MDDLCSYRAMAEYRSTAVMQSTTYYWCTDLLLLLPQRDAGGEQFKSLKIL
jgi:hypothetical protein